MKRLASVGWVFALLITAVPTTFAADPETLRVMTFNLWIGGDAGGQPLKQTAQVIQAARADVVGLQETIGQDRGGGPPDNAKRVAELLSWNYFDQGDGRAVICRYPIVGATPKKWGVQFQLPSGRKAWVFNAHFAHAPYQPYQLLRIPYGDGKFIKRAEEAVDEARNARGDEVAAMLREIEEFASTEETTLVTGDFNEPSALDWTDAAQRAGRCPVAVVWPTTSAVLSAGFVDGYRHLHPNPVDAPGYTWTSTTAEDDPKDRHDRIDFVFVRGPAAVLDRAEVVGERAERADIVVTPYPSDHRAVVVTLTVR